MLFLSSFCCFVCWSVLFSSIGLGDGVWYEGWDVCIIRCGNCSGGWVICFVYRVGCNIDFICSHTDFGVFGNDFETCNVGWDARFE